MTQPRFTTSIAEVYDRLLVPLIFQGYAEDLARRVAALAPHAILETAAGSGVVTRALEPLIGVGVEHVVTDLSREMLQRAIRRQPGAKRYVWQQADAQDLPFEDGRFDVVLCQFGAMFFPDRVRAYAEARRVLRPGGRFLFSLWCPIAQNALPAAVEEALRGQFPDDPPDFMSRIPHGHGDAAVIRDELARAGFASVEVEARGDIARAADAAAVAEAFCMGTPLRAEITARAPERLQAVTDAVARTLAARFGDGPVEGPIRALVVAAVS